MGFKRNSIYGFDMDHDGDEDGDDDILYLEEVEDFKRIYGIGEYAEEEDEDDEEGDDGDGMSDVITAYNSGE